MIDNMAERIHEGQGMKVVSRSWRARDNIFSPKEQGPIYIDFKFLIFRYLRV